MDPYTDKLITLASVEIVHNLTSIKFPNSSDTFIIIEEPYFVKMIPAYVNHQSFIFEPLQEFILKYYQSGFAAKLANEIEYGLERYEYLDGNLKNVRKINSQPKVLTLHMLEAGFVLWIAIILVAFVVFIGEHLLSYIRKKLKILNLKNKQHVRKL